MLRHGPCSCSLRGHGRGLLCTPASHSAMALVAAALPSASKEAAGSSRTLSTSTIEREAHHLFDRILQRGNLTKLNIW